MSCWYELEMSCTMYSQIICYLESYAKHLKSYSDIEDIVHTIDALEDEKNNFLDKENDMYKESERIKKMFDKHNKTNSGLLYKTVKDILDEYDIHLDSEYEFFLIIDILEKLNKIYTNYPFVFKEANEES